MKAISSWTAGLAAVVLLSSSVYAYGGHDRGGRYEPQRHMKMSNNYHGHHHSNGNWVVPLVIGGVLGYVLSEPRQESVTYVSSAPVVYNPQPTYQEQWVYFSDCDCQRKVLVRVR
ncbi:hypothetical protein [Sulfuricurvum sp.]|uniref:hypothetical protein n=1 Tax=Sulfuricurvum sp. TaxID=2025608 RepID=UPI003BB6469A